MAVIAHPMTLGRPDDRTPWTVVGPGVARQAGWETVEVVPADDFRGAVEAGRALGSAWRGGRSDREIGAALARLEDALGLREQGGQ